MNPHSTAHYPIPPEGLNENWKKYIIQASTANDIRLTFSEKQKLLIPKADNTSYSHPAYTKPYHKYKGISYLENTDICFSRMVSPDFDLWLEKIKICLHSKSTYGCVKVNVWNFGSSYTSMPINLTGIIGGEPDYMNVPVSIGSEQNLISNVLDSTDEYMVLSNQVPKISPFLNTISANSLLRFGIQYAEGNGYGLKIFLICWALECDRTDSDPIGEPCDDSSSNGGDGGGIGGGDGGGPPVSLGFPCGGISDPPGTLIDSYSESNANNWNSLATLTGIGQALTLSSPKTLTSAKFYLRKYDASVTGSIWAEVYAATGVVGSSAHPWGLPLTSSLKCDASILSETTGLVEFTFSTEYIASGDIVVALRGDLTGIVEVHHEEWTHIGPKPSHAGNYCALSVTNIWVGLPDVSADWMDLCFYLYGN